jgi:hypothetical protein
VRVDHLPHFYSKHLRKTLQESIEDALDVAPEEQVAVFEELATMRETVVPVLKMWDAAHELEGQKGLELQASAGSLLRDQLKEVAAVAETANRIMLSGKDQFSIHTLGHIINQIVRIAFDVFGEDELERAEHFERMVRERIKMPTAENKGTLVTPDMDVAEMDDTVPTEEDE